MFSAALASTSAVRKTATPLSTTYSIAFDGQNDFINIGQAGDLTIDPDSGSFSGACWIYVGSLAQNQAIAAKGYASTANIDFFLGVSSAGALYMYVGGSSATSANGVISANTWYHVAWSIAAGSGTFYLNGVKAHTGAIVGGSSTTGADFLIGASRYVDNTDNAFPFCGLINNFTIYGSYGMTANDAKFLYNGGVPATPNADYLAGYLTHWYKMGDDATNDMNDANQTAKHIHDQIGSAHGTMSNFLQGALWQKSPTGEASSTYAYFPQDNGVDFHFRATDITNGTSDWTDNYAAISAVRQGVGGSTKRNSAFSGVSELTSGEWWKVAAAASYLLKGTTQWTIGIRYYTGYHDVSGGFLMGNDASGESANNKTDWQLFNKNYNLDCGFRVHDKTNAESDATTSTLRNVNRYVSQLVVIDIVNGTIKIYENGTLYSSISGLTASNFNNASNTTAPLGIMGVPYIAGSGYYSQANGAAYVEFIRYQHIFSSREIAEREAAWNVRKGWFATDNVVPVAGTNPSFSSTSSSSTTVTWGAGSDTTTPTGSLQYKLVRAATSAAIDSIAECNAITSGSGLIMDWTTATLSKVDNTVVSGQTYYYNVIVKDAAGNTTVYTPQSVAIP